MAQEFVKVAKIDELPAGEMISVEVEGRPVLIANVDGELFALGDECTHAGSLLSGGYLDGCQVECPTHGALFDVKTGEVMSPPADEGTPTYRVKVDGQSILVGVPE
jgi:nitrite reductase/ring-hydroxylating ferredoxin subunit